MISLALNSHEFHKTCVVIKQLSAHEPLALWLAVEEEVSWFVLIPTEKIT